LTGSSITCPLFQGEKHAQDIANGFNPFAHHPGAGYIISLRKKDNDCQKGTENQNRSGRCGPSEGIGGGTTKKRS
jgi:hypothetical protein